MINQTEHGAPYSIARCNCWIKGKSFILWLSLKHAQRRIEDPLKCNFTLADLRQYGSYNYYHSIDLVFDTTPMIVGLRRMLAESNKLIYLVAHASGWNMFISAETGVWSLKPNIMGLRDWGLMVPRAESRETR